MRVGEGAYPSYALSPATFTTESPPMSRDMTKLLPFPESLGAVALGLGDAIMEDNWLRVEMYLVELNLFTNQLRLAVGMDQDELLKRTVARRAAIIQGHPAMRGANASGLLVLPNRKPDDEK